MSGHNLKLKIRSLRKTYGAVVALDSVDIDLREGEFLTLLGPSGSGKSTLLWAVAGLNDPDSGQVWIDGREATHLPPFQREIGMVFQNYALFPHMTVAENLAFPLEVRGMSRADTEAKVNRALDMVELGEFGHRRPAQLSGGQQQRVALARALVFEPDLVLMDEPLGALDKNLREQMQYEIKHIHENLGMTVVYVTHDQSEALTMSDRIAVFNDGVIQQLAPPADLYERPENAFVAQFIGENNRLIGNVMSVDGDRCAVDVGGHLIQSLSVNHDGKGARSTLSLRPERVQLNPEDGAFPNVFDAKVMELIYLGDHIRCRVSVCGNDEFIVKVPNAHGQVTMKRGDDVRVGWQAEDCRALDA